MKPFGDPYLGQMYGADGQLFAFNPSRKDNGLVVITHGLRSGIRNSPWLQDMAQRIETRFVAEGKGPPNIVVFDWSEEQ